MNQKNAKRLRRIFNPQEGDEVSKKSYRVAKKHFKKLPIYNLLSSKGPRHKPTFKVSVSIVGTKKFIGTGSSKQQAEQ